MPSFTERLIAAHQAGLAERRAEEQRLQQQEDRKLQQQVLKHSIDRLKIQDALENRQAAAQNFQFLQGQPATEIPVANPEATPMSYPGQIGQGPSMGGGTTSAEAPLPKVQIPGIDELGIAGISLQPQSMQQMLRAKNQAELQAKLLEARFKTTTTKPGETTTVGTPGITDTTSATNREPEPPTGDYGKYFLPAYAAKLNKTVAALTPAESLAAFQEFKTISQDPDAKAQLKAIRDLQIQTTQIQLGQQPTAEDIQTTAENLVAHRIAPSQIPAGMGAGGQAFKRAVLTKALALDKDFSMEDAEASYQLVKSPSFQNTVRYMDSVQESIPLVIDRAKKLANGNIQSINALLNAGRSQVSNVDLKKFNTDRILVADEIAKILQGGGTGSGTSDAKLNQAAEILNKNDSPAAIAATLADVQELIGYRKKALTRRTYLEDKRTPAGGRETRVTLPGGGIAVYGADGKLIRTEGK